METLNKAQGRGGKRPGSGRKAIGELKLGHKYTVRLGSETGRWLEAIAQQHGVTATVMVRVLLDRMMAQVLADRLAAERAMQVAMTERDAEAKRLAAVREHDASMCKLPAERRQSAVHEAWACSMGGKVVVTDDGPVFLVTYTPVERDLDVSRMVFNKYADAVTCAKGIATAASRMAAAAWGLA